MTDLGLRLLGSSPARAIPGTTAFWAAHNPVLRLGVIGIDTNLNRLKVGDGVTQWDELDWLTDGSNNIVSQAIDQSAVSAALLPGGYAILTGLRVVLPPSTHGYVIHYGGSLLCTTSGTGIAGIGIAETTSGVLVENDFKWVGGVYSASGTYTPLIGTVEGSKDIDPSPNWRVFRLIGMVLSDSGLLRVSLGSSTSGGGLHDRSPFLRVVAA